MKGKKEKESKKWTDNLSLYNLLAVAAHESVCYLAVTLFKTVYLFLEVSSFYFFKKELLRAKFVSLYLTLYQYLCMGFFLSIFTNINLRFIYKSFINKLINNLSLNAIRTNILMILTDSIINYLLILMWEIVSSAISLHIIINLFN